MLLDKYPKSIYISLTKDLQQITSFSFKAPIAKISKRIAASVGTRDIRSKVSIDPEIVITDCLQYASEKDVKRMYQQLDCYHPVYIHLG